MWSVHIRMSILYLCKIYYKFLSIIAVTYFIAILCAICCESHTKIIQTRASWTIYSNIYLLVKFMNELFINVYENA